MADISLKQVLPLRIEFTHELALLRLDLGLAIFNDLLPFKRLNGRLKVLIDDVGPRKWLEMDIKKLTG